MTDTLRLPAPAKLNLMLRIVGRRADGYHLLQTVFQFIDRCDWIDLGRRDDGQIRLARPLPGVPEESDLTVRAAQLLKRHVGRPDLGVNLAVEKNLPMGGGLGGGSSDAATVLVGLNRLWNLGLPEDSLAKLGLSLGADVPVFVRGRAAWAEGVGEHLRPLSDLAEPWYVVVVPDCHVATAAVFGAPDLTRDSAPITIADFSRGDRRNDCLPVVRKAYPPVAAALDRLASLSDAAKLTGTGACVFAEFECESTARDVVKRLAAENWTAFAAKGANLSPLQRTLSQD
ncbi:MAG: 4-(cytidine 5'-diphospho)-2-C-methyl-D-erythritol kinase [Methylococcaceae bacterium]|nr:4-(cytidine 5'-diphospho)-2-C-methyl-D-erythritol kinase [Methylococcaceae bacterium]